MATHSNRTLALCLVVTLVTMWCVHAFTNIVISPSGAEITQSSPDMTDHGHSHEPLVSHTAYDIEHQHNGHTADHTHDSVQLTAEADHEPFELSATPGSTVPAFPLPPLDTIKKPPRSLS